MSLKCSILGHDYADPEIEREREEQGSEVVITITETETCRRCGETRVVSENKEVTSLETPSDIVGDDLDEEEPPADEADDGERVGEAGAEPDRGAGGSAGESPETAAAEVAEAGQEPSGPEDDAVILDDEDEDETERQPGEWPDEGEGGGDETAPEPGADATTGERPAGEWPEEETDDGDWTPDIETDPDPEEIESDIEPTEDAITVPDGEFYCQECGFTTPVESSSLREGDFCPECHRGTLTHQAPEE